MGPFGFNVRVFLMVNGAETNILAFEELGLNVEHIASKKIVPTKDNSHRSGPWLLGKEQNGHGRVHRGCYLQHCV